MHVVIDIPEEAYNDIQSRNWKNGELIFSEEWKAIHNGTPIPDNANILTVTEWADRCRECGKGFIKIPDNATNGQVIQTLFKPNRVERTDDDVIVEHYDFSKDWWNAPYQKGGKE